jgi:peptide/nickel transport system substrate-binding protein
MSSTGSRAPPFSVSNHPENCYFGNHSVKFSTTLYQSEEKEMRSIPRKLVVWITAVLAVMLAATACTSAKGATTGAAGATGGTLTIGLDAAPTSFDPGLVRSGGTTVLLWQSTFDTLLKYNPDGTVTPNAAESYTFTDNNTVMTLKLRAGMTFTDGSPVDSAAVKASLEHMRDGTGSDAKRLAGIVVTTPDASTVVITTPKPTGLLPMFLCLAPGIIANPKSFTAADVATNPQGSGPYKIDPSATTSGSTWTFVRNENYWNKAAYPYDKVVFKLLEDVTARINALASGQINAAGVTSQTQAQAQAQGATILSNDVNWAGLFISDRAGEKIPALGNLKVRQAMNMVFDRQAIVTALFQGQGKVTNQIFNPQSDAYLPDALGQYPFDVDKAKALMSEAGYADGFDLHIPAATGLDAANPLIIQQLGLLNIRVTADPVPSNQIFKSLLGGDYPVFYFTLESRTALWDIVQSLDENSIWNMFHSTDPALTPLLAQAQTATGDAAKTNAQAINKEILDQAWFSPWALPTNFWATKGTTAQPVLGSTAPYLYTFKP